MAVRVAPTSTLSTSIRDTPVVETDRSTPGSGFGHVALAVACAGIGLLVCSVANTLSRATLAPPSVIYWAGLLIVALPIFYRLSSREPSSGERLTLVCLLGMTLYGVKLARDTLLYTIPDETIHAFNAEQITRHHHLFHANPILPISPDYPGLEGATSALMTMTGMTSFGAGIIIIGAARLALLIGLFVLFRRISGSARIAGLGVAIYVCNSNFMFFSAQYSYESLALPLLVVLMVAIAERGVAPRSWASAWAIPIVLLTAAVVVTHHLTSYALTAILIALVLLYWMQGRWVEWPNPWPFAVLAICLTAAWLVVVASATVGYLSPVLGNALSATLDTATGSDTPRTLFDDPSGGPTPTPVIARIIAFASTLILAVGLPFGLRQVWWQYWHRYRAQPFALLFCAAAIGFFATLGLRFAPAAWETGNRAGEFLFIGVAFVLALAFVRAFSRLEALGPRFAPWLGRGLLTACLGIVLTGGVISGWPWDAQLASPVRATAEGRSIESEPLGLAGWAARHLRGRRFAGSNVDARLLLVHGGATTALSGDTVPEIGDLLGSPALESWQLPILRQHRLRYVVADRRRRSNDTTRGYSFSVRPPGGERDRLLPAKSVLKFERIPAAARVLDSGSIVVYDLEARR